MVSDMANGGVVCLDEALRNALTGLDTVMADDLPDVSIGGLTK